MSSFVVPKMFGGSSITSSSVLTAISAANGLADLLEKNLKAGSFGNSTVTVSPLLSPLVALPVTVVVLVGISSSVKNVGSCTYTLLPKTVALCAPLIGYLAPSISI